MVMQFLQRVIVATIDLLNSASAWLIFSFLLAGLLHNVLNPAKFQKMLGNTRISSLFKATASGMLLPMCSCGVIPLGMSMYYSGAYLGPTLAFNTATPIINPAAVILTYGLLGPQMALIYLLAGFLIPMIIGIIGNRLAGPELFLPGLNFAGEEVITLETEEESLKEKLLSGLKWGFGDMGVQVSKFVVPGMLLAALIFLALPPGFIQQYLGNPSFISIGSMALLAMLMYVCAVGHIPFVAALVAAGASPGAALTFLMAGAATNLPELISMYKMMGKRTVVIYSISLFASAILVGYLTNWLLMPGYTPVFDLSRTQQAIGWANHFILSPPLFLRYLATLAIMVMAFKAYGEKIRLYFSRKKTRRMNGYEQA